MKSRIIIAIVFLSVSDIWAQVDPVNEKKVAIGGYDLTTYFGTSGPRKGTASNAVLYQGVTYYFVSTENKNRFESEPQRYLPQYDGYCALGVSYGKKISIDPLTYKILDGKLYLFYHTRSGINPVNSLDTWNKNEAKLLNKADELWPEVSRSRHVEH